MTTPGPAAASRAYPFEARPLTDPADPAAVRRFDTALRQRFPALRGGTVALVIGAVVLVPFLLVFLGFFAFILSQFAAAGLGLVTVPFMIGIVVVVGLIVWAVARQFANGGPRERRYRLDGFARANAMEYLPVLADPRLPGMIFDRGGDRKATDLLRGERPRFVEFANYQYTTGSGDKRTTHNWGYVAIHLGTPLPHIVLDALGNNGVFGSNLPAQFARAQRLSLEGDFDRYFTLYCPEGYERDALYLFTPDVMARFVDSAGQLDVEIVDEWLFLYTRRPVSTVDPANWAWLFSAVSALMDKLGQWERWRDERLAATQTSASAGAIAGSGPLPFHTPTATAPPAPEAWLGPRGVARPGRRLKRGVSWVAIGIAAVVLLGWILPMLLGGPLALILGG